LGQFLPILATFYEFKNHILKKVGKARAGYMFCFVLGYQVSKYDVAYVGVDNPDQLSGRLS
jgi:hypothetical protein